MAPNNQSDHDLLITLNERMSAMAEALEEMKGNFVTKTEFQPVKAIVFGGVAIVLVAFMSYLVYVANHQPTL